MEGLIDDMDESFVYEPLRYQEHDFRLLSLLAGRHAGIQCQLHHAAFDSEPYEALSYVWGNLELVETIEVNGKTLRITDNLHAALHHLRLPDRDRLLWIDAVCINQSEDVERSHQVRMMSEIYQRADKVIVWLGKATAEIQYMMRQLQGLTGREAQFNGLAKCAADDRVLTGFRTLMIRPWFKRVWILQEVANARTVVICVGQHSITGHAFAHLAAALHLDVGQHCAAVLDIISKDSTSNAGDRRLSALLLKYQGCEASDERDRIYALQGMCSDDEDIAELLPDYTLSTSQTVTHAARYLLSFGKCSVATVLDFIGTFKTITTLCLLPELTEDLRPADFYSRGYKPQSTSTRLERIDRLSAAQKAALFCIEQAVEAEHERPLQTCFGQVVGLSSHDLATAGAGVNNHRKQHIKLLVLTSRFYIVDTCYRPELEKLVDLSFEVSSTQSAFREWVFGSLLGRSDISLERVISTLRPSRTELNELLSRAIKGRRETLVEALVHAGAGVNAQEVQTAGDPLLLAARQGHDGIMRVLLRTGASVDGDPNRPGRETALIVAARLGYTSIVQILLEAGADVNHVSSDSDDGVVWEYTALTKASLLDNIDVVQMLIDAGAEVNPRGEWMDIPLEVASDRGSFDVVQALLVAGADVNGHTWRDSPLASASRRGHSKVVRLLLDAGADVNAASGSRANTAVRAAALRGRQDIVQMLVDAGAEYGEQAEETDS